MPDSKDTIVEDKLPIPYVYKISQNPTKTGRKMVVIAGQPYYQSTGRNSGVPNVWFPFIMIRGSYAVNKIKSPIFVSDIFHKINSKENPYYIIKVLRHYLSQKVDTLLDDEDDKIIHKRNSLKNTLITAARLTGPNFPEKTLNQSGLTTDELKLARDPLILKKEPQFCTDNPEKINDWLIQQGAHVVFELLNKEKKSLQTNPAEVKTEHHNRTKPY